MSNRGLSDQAIADLIDSNLSDLEGFDSDDDSIADPTYHAEDTGQQGDSGDESSEDIEEPQQPPPDPPDRHRRIKWKHTDIFDPLPPAPDNDDAADDDADITGNIYDLFRNYVPEYIYEVISDKTNQNYMRIKGVELRMTPEEIRKLFGMTIAMSFLKFPQIRMYWANSTRVPFNL